MGMLCLAPHYFNWCLWFVGLAKEQVPHEISKRERLGLL
jgi:hypothetical protein